MISRFSRSLSALFVLATGTALSAPTFDEILSTGPKNVIGPLQSNPIYNYTPWHLAAFSGEEGKMSVTFKAEANIWSLASGGKEFLLSEGFFLAWENNFGPTEKLIESTRPDPLEGGTWTFDFSYRAASYWSGDAHHVASWTWTQDAPPAPPVATTPGKNVRMSLNLNRAVVRSLREKESRKAHSLLTRQENLLRAVLSETN